MDNGLKRGQGPIMLGACGGRSVVQVEQGLSPGLSHASRQWVDGGGDKAKSSRHLLHY